MKGNCELCESPARIYCESDEARLCWSCDAKVHSANFLVAKHSRNLLCHVCQSPTAWNACGERLGRTVSVCESCVNGCERVKDSRCREEEDCEGEGGHDEEMESGGDYDGDKYDDDDDDDDDIDEEEEEEEEEVESDDDGENQVVPLSSTSPPSLCSSSSGDYRSRFCFTDDISSKKAPDNVPDLCSNDDIECLSSQLLNRQSTPAESYPYQSEEDVDSESMRPSKVRKLEGNRLFDIRRKPADLISSTHVESLNRLHYKDINSGENSSDEIYRSNENRVRFGLFRALKSWSD